MSIFSGLRNAWIRLSENKSNGDIVYSEDNKLIVSKLNVLLNDLINIVDNENGIADALKEFRDDFIIMRDEMKCKWHYKLVRLSIDNVNDNGNHLFELFVDNRKVIEIVIKITSNCDISDFSIKYLVNVNDYINYGPCEGTKVIEMNCLEEDSFVYYDNIYSLDLLNHSYSEEVLKDNWVSDGKFTFTRKRH